MDKEVINNTFSIVNSLKNEQKFDSDLDTQINLLFSIISDNLHSQNTETAQTVKKVLEDKLLHQEIENMKSFYLGKLSGLSQIIGQIKHLIEFELFADSLSDAEINSLLHIFTRGEIVNELIVENDKYMLEESSNNLLNLKNKDLILSNQFSCYTIHTLSFKGNEVINLLHKKKKISLKSSELSYHGYDIEKQNTHNNKINTINIKLKQHLIESNKNKGFYPLNDCDELDIDYNPINLLYNTVLRKDD